MLLIAAALSAVAVAPAEAKFNTKKSIWGPVTVDGQSAFPIYKDLGVGIYSIALDWSKVAPGTTKPSGDLTDPNNPAYTWPDSLTDAVSAATTAGIKVNIEITKVPLWARSSRYCATNRGCQPTDPADYARFATAAAKRYPVVHLWMVWGEPNRQANFFGYQKADWRASTLTDAQAQGPRAYARLLDAAYGALHAPSLPGSSQNQVIGGNTEPAGDIMPGVWIKYMKLKDTKTGNYTKAPRIDMYGHNVFPMSQRKPALNPIPSSHNLIDFSDLQRLHTLVDTQLAKPAGKSTIKLFLSEICIPTGPNDGEFQYWVQADPAKDRVDNQVSWINSAFAAVNANSWIHSMGWIHLKDVPQSKYVTDYNKAHPTKKIVDPYATQSGLFFADGTKKPGYTAFQNG